MNLCARSYFDTIKKGLAPFGAVLFFCVFYVFSSELYADSAKGNSKKIVTTTEIIADLVRSIATPDFEVSALMGPGIDPHLYRATYNDIKKIESADIIFINGLHLEGKMALVLERLARSKTVVSLGDRLPRDKLRSPADLPDLYDPHIWFDLHLWSLAAPLVADALTTVSPENQQTLQNNATATRSRFQELDRWILDQVRLIPAEKRVLITAHDAFGYFGARYGLEVQPLQGISTTTEASLAQVNALVDLVVTRKVPAVFIETTVSPRFIEAITAGARARGSTLKIGGELYSDAPGPAGSGAETLEGMIKHNVKTIVSALSQS